MKKLKTIIIEDEKPAARKLERMLGNFPDIEVIANISSVEEGIAWFGTNEHPDLIFSDIQLGDGLSFDIFEKIPTKSFMIYTTAFDQYAMKAFKLNSIDYLLKPILEDDLAKAIEKYRQFLPEENTIDTHEIKSLLKKEKNFLSRVLVKIGYNLKIINIEDISCFYSENKIVYLQTAERTFPTDYTLEELQEILDPKFFFRVNRQFIIHSKFIKNIHTSPYYKLDVEFQPQEEITISRDRVKDFKDWLAN